MLSSSAARAWLLGRVDRQCTSEVLALLDRLTEDLSLATSDAVTLRRLSPDGRWLHPVTAYHPDPEIRAALLEGTTASAEVATTDAWRSVLAERRARRWHVPPGTVPGEAAPAQADHLRRFPVRAALFAPLVTPREDLVGGVALTRYAVDRPFSDAEEQLLVDFAARAALAVDFLRAVTELEEGGSRRS